jgi:hypothetical protein
LLPVKIVDILRGVGSRDRPSDVRTVSQLKGAPECALRVARTLQARQLFDQIKAELSGVVDRGHRAQYVALPERSEQWKRKQATPSRIIETSPSLRSHGSHYEN